ncbi:uncharacterized protein LOC133895143 [Phragmites australis]|uniref:uncharacterized protein LOC133895143 n=1 Tax=Phragmites australis TaxID=29695 RepID=UPI002D766B30|nr:uncharacterized protein LOC133895143 [Phragmites australis]
MRKLDDDDDDFEAEFQAFSKAFDEKDERHYEFMALCRFKDGLMDVSRPSKENTGVVFPNEDAIINEKPTHTDEATIVRPKRERKSTYRTPEDAARAYDAEDQKPAELVPATKLSANPVAGFTNNSNDDLFSVVNFSSSSATFIPAEALGLLPMTKAHVPCETSGKIGVFPIQNRLPFGSVVNGLGNEASRALNTCSILRHASMPVFNDPAFDGPSTMIGSNGGAVVPTWSSVVMPNLPLDMSVADAGIKIDQHIIKEMENKHIPAFLQGDVSEDVAAEINMWDFYDHLLLA